MSSIYLRQAISFRYFHVAKTISTGISGNFLFYSSDSKFSEIKHCKPDWIPFSHPKVGNFFQERPKLYNPFLTDLLLQRYIKSRVPKEVTNEIIKDLSNFGTRIVEEIDDLGWECELELPILKYHDAWGKCINKLYTSNAWKQQHQISAEEGLVAIGYERKLNEWSRLHQVCKLFLYSPSAGMYTCPLAMTDGAAKTIEIIGNGNLLLKTALEHLTSRDPTKFWTSGQWMTERKGGSDVANGTETIAIPEGDFYRLYGYKWFTSATDSNIALTLAKEMGKSDDSLDKKALTLFYLETKASDGCLNNIHIMRLKDKLGTRQVPTAELLLDGAIAYKVSEKGYGVSAISNMLNITRLYNAIGAVAGMRRILMLARDYAQHRSTFGRKIAEYPLHMQVLSRMEVEVRGSLMLLLKVAILLGNTEVKTASVDETQLLRLLLPILKLYTAKQSIAVISEGLEAFGGQGYMEDTRLPVMLRDAQVLPIWEGTTNIMALDVLRSIEKSNGAVLKSFQQSVQFILNIGKQNEALVNSCFKIESSLLYILNYVKEFPEFLPTAARDFSYSLARTYIGALLIENACLTKNYNDVITAQRWCEFQQLCPLFEYHEKSSYSNCLLEDNDIVMEGYYDA